MPLILEKRKGTYSCDIDLNTRTDFFDEMFVMILWSEKWIEHVSDDANNRDVGRDHPRFNLFSSSLSPPHRQSIPRGSK